MKHILIGLVRLYRLLLSPWVGGQCRFYPTCSQYTIEALERHGAAAGTYLGAARILRCQPWCLGGHEPVPEVFTWAPWRHRDEADAQAQQEAGDATRDASPPAMHNSASTSEESVSPAASGPGARAPKPPSPLLSSKL
ncbi:putative membrane protein insertion efficiency factor [Thiomonas bhubaneswarensis]|uniref:Putative membrane protein insertion efficiency factor n=1 Tax=Thiomonas bhubaneswarensis TaxID=339866 RepID=A0A0K6IB93_9BURK|nr:putative membrane protein insertion efficiency factor [Thiomonas bhubaneswarensis]